MPADWDWFFASEASRDRMLKREIDGLQSSAAAARSQSLRLSSQLRNLQGSLETRLGALSAAFDAYVELGDVREELDGYPDSRAIRRDALRAIEALTRGVRPAPVPRRNLDYWLADAVNALIDIALIDIVQNGSTTDGWSKIPPEPDAQWFIVAAAGALGQGRRVADRVPNLLTSDGSLSARQLALWDAARGGVFGDVLDDVRAVWEPTLDLSATTWVSWVRASARSSGPLTSLHWLQRFLSAGAPAPTPTEPDPDRDTVSAGLRQVVGELVAAGYGDERALLERARVLRQRIEHPTAALLPPRDQAEAGPGVTTVVQRVLADRATDPGVRHVLTQWVRPGLDAAARSFGEAVAAATMPVSTVATEAGTLVLTDGRADPGRLREIDRALQQRYATARSAPRIPLGLAAALLLLGLALLAGRVVAIGVLVLIAAVVAGSVALARQRRHRQAQAALVQAREWLRVKVADGEASAQASAQAHRDDQAEAAALVTQIVGEQPRPVAVGNELR